MKNDSAFPRTRTHNDLEDALQSKGLTKREYFAGLAMQGLCVPFIPGNHNGNQPDEANYKAKMAVRLADALIEELEKK